MVDIPNRYAIVWLQTGKMKNMSDALHNPNDFNPDYQKLTNKMEFWAQFDALPREIRDLINEEGDENKLISELVNKALELNE